MSSPRRLAREIALKTLYQVAIGGMDAEVALAGALEANEKQEPDPLAWAAVAEYAGKLVRGVVARGDEYDGILERYARNWDPERMPTVDHILLHVALEEIKQGVPHGAAIDEAVELAKEYSTEESGRFVNGILGAYVRTEGPESEQTA